jgi:hypothetical protein
MESPRQRRVLVVANRTAATPGLIQAVRDRAAKGPATFTLLVPQQTGTIHRLASTEDEHTDPSEADSVLELAIPLLQEAAGGPVEGSTGDPDPLTAIQDAVNVQGYDEIILSTLPARVSRWLKLDLVHKLDGLGLPVTHVEAEGRED